MTNSAIITKIEYRFTESDTWVAITFIPGSAKLEQNSKREPGGTVFTIKVPFKISKNQSIANEPVSTLLLRRAIYRVTDGNKTTYIIGTDQIKARLQYTVTVAGNAGGFNGREVEITCKSTTGVAIA